MIEACENLLKAAEKDKAEAIDLKDAKATETDEAKLKLEQEQKKSQTLAAENAGLAFQLTTDKSVHEVEKKQLWNQIEVGKMEIERLDQDVFRLANKLMAVNGPNNDPKAMENLNPLAPPPQQAVATLKAEVEQPENFVHRQAPFDYTIVSNPNSPASAAVATQRRIDALEEQLKIYRVLLEEGNKYRKASGIRAKLLEAGLFMGQPFKSYATSQYYRGIGKARGNGGGDDVEGGLAYSEYSTVPVPAELDNTEMVEWEELF